jgi:hypothetical protein
VSYLDTMRLGLLCSLAALVVACGSSSKPPKPSPADGGEGGESSSGRGGSVGKAGNAGRGGGGGKAGSSGNGASGGSGGDDAGIAGEGGVAAGGAEAGVGGSDAGSGGASNTTGGSGGDGGIANSGGAAADGGVPGTGGTEAGSSGSGGSDTGGTGGGPECSPSNDECPAGTYCSPELECVRGCREDADCASGRCSNHDCERCLGDDECRAGLVCGSGTCGEPCSNSDECGGLTCCDGRCVDVSRDVAHCGACGGAESPNTCSTDEFCGTSGCNDATLANVCDNALVTVVEDGLGPDEAAAAALGAVLVTGCDPPPESRTVDEATTDALNPTNGRPVIGGGEVLVIAGGPYGQAVMSYLESERIAPVYARVGAGTYELARSSDDATLGSIPQESSDDTHDLLLIEVVRDPASGTFLLVCYGFNEYGTATAVWYLANVMVPGPLSMYDQRYYVIEWTDDGDLTPDLDDTFDVLASG